MLTGTPRLLPQPLNSLSISDDENDIQLQASSQAIVTRAVVPPYGQRTVWKPTSQDDFGEFFIVNYLGIILMTLF